MYVADVHVCCRHKVSPYYADMQRAVKFKVYFLHRDADAVKSNYSQIAVYHIILVNKFY